MFPIATNFPRDTENLIISYLNYKDVARSEQVCHHWRVRLNTQEIWKKVYQKEYPESSPSADWKKHFIRRFTIPTRLAQPIQQEFHFPTRVSGLDIEYNIFISGNRLYLLKNDDNQNFLDFGLHIYDLHTKQKIHFVKEFPTLFYSTLKAVDENRYIVITENKFWVYQINPKQLGDTCLFEASNLGGNSIILLNNTIIYPSPIKEKQNSKFIDLIITTISPNRSTFSIETCADFDISEYVNPHAAIREDLLILQNSSTLLAIDLKKQAIAYHIDFSPSAIETAIIAEKHFAVWLLNQSKITIHELTIGFPLHTIDLHVDNFWLFAYPKACTPSTLFGISQDDKQYISAWDLNTGLITNKYPFFHPGKCQKLIAHSNRLIGSFARSFSDKEMCVLIWDIDTAKLVCSTYLNYNTVNMEIKVFDHILYWHCHGYGTERQIMGVTTGVWNFTPPSIHLWDLANNKYLGYLSVKLANTREAIKIYDGKITHGIFPRDRSMFSGKVPNTLAVYDILGDLQPQPGYLKRLLGWLYPS